MVDQPMELVAAHLQVYPNLLEGLGIRYYRISDLDLKQTGGIIMFRPNATGASTFTLRKTDVLIRLICDPENVRAYADKMELIRNRFYDRFSADGVVHFQPMTEVLGPNYLDNNRATYDLNVRVMIDPDTI